MAKKRGVRNSRSSSSKKANISQKQVKKVNADLQKKVEENPVVGVVAENKRYLPFLSRIFDHNSNAPNPQKGEEHASTKLEEFRDHEEAELQQLEKEVKELESEKETKQQPKDSIPAWFYISSIFAAFLFTIYISIFATIHFESIEYMKITIVFLFIAIISYFLVSTTYFISEKKIGHSLPAFLFFAGVSAIMVYAFKAVDTSNLVRFSIIYSIIVTAISAYILATKRK